MDRSLFFDQLIKRVGALSCDELDQFFAGLEPVDIDETLGEWRGGYLKGWKFFFRNFILFKWLGKHFISAEKAKAQVWSVLGFKISFGLGNSRLRRIEFRDKVSTALIYNYLPLIDHFRKVDDKILMGIMEIKGRIQVYFYLQRI